jgi:hypothetical protein
MSLAEILTAQSGLCQCLIEVERRRASCSPSCKGVVGTFGGPQIVEQGGYPPPFAPRQDDVRWLPFVLYDFGTSRCATIGVSAADWTFMIGESACRREAA